MKFESTELLHVFLDSEGQRRRLGRLAFKNRQILFEYDESFLASGIELSPIHLPLRPGVFRANTAIYDGLFGVFNDSLPDGWGRLLLDRTVAKHGILRGQLNPLDRLAYVGRRGMGAISYEPELNSLSGDGKPLSLDKLAEESAIMLEGKNEEVFEELLRLNGSSGGARPKIVAQVSADKKTLIHGQQELRPGYSHWIVKFASSQDARDIGSIEYAYSLMARDAGVDMPETHLFRTKKNRYFGIRRFDRNGDIRIHMHSLGGLLHSDHRTPSLDYDDVLTVTTGLTKNIQDAEKVYALACFNVLAHNRDDHSKNFSFLLNGRNEWVFAPAYDLVFSFGPGGEQSTLVMGNGRDPGVQELQTLGKKHSLKSAPAILTRVQQAVSNWSRYAEQSGVSAKPAKAIAGRLQR